METIKMYYWPLMLAVLVSGLVFTGCSSDDDDEEGFNYPMETLYGTWIGTGIYTESDGTWIDPTSSLLYESLQFSITFYENGTYYGKGFFGTGRGTYKAEGNTITTYVNGEMYLYYKVTSLTNDKAELTMYDGSGDSMRLRVTKESSVSSEIPADTPKDSVVLTINYTFGESGDMTRATGAEVYTAFYEKYIKTKVLTPKTYSLTFKNKETGATAATLNGYWGSKDGIRLPEGEYIVTGTSIPTNNSTVSDTVFISFNETVNITKDMQSLNLTANYDSYLLMLDNENYSKVNYYQYYASYNTMTLDLYQTDTNYFLFVKSLRSGSNTLNLTRNDGTKSSITLDNLPFSKGKYYYFNDMTNSFDIPMMESGN